MRILTITIILALSSQFGFAAEWTKEQVKNIIVKVNDTWQSNHPNQERSFWDPAVYHTGNMEAYKLLRKKEWYDYSVAWGEQNQWMGAREADQSKWKYANYGEGMDYVLFGDWQICFQTYIDLVTEGGCESSCEKKCESSCEKECESSCEKKCEKKCCKKEKQDCCKLKDERIARAFEVMDYEVNSGKSDYWWWADALYMVMPVFTKLYTITGNEKYLDQMYANWQYSNSIMYDKETGLYFRDGKYVYPKHKTAAGKKDFWARGDGWVLAAFAKVLKDMPKKYKHRKEIVTYYKAMAAAVKAAQQDEGYWTRSMLDPEQAPGRETSGTALFCYGLLWGINNGILPAKTYKPVAEKAWNYLATIALQEDGTVGYVQPIGEKAIPGQVVNQKSVTNFGTGAFLLAACEYYRSIK